MGSIGAVELILLIACGGGVLVAIIVAIYLAMRDRE